MLWILFVVGAVLSWGIYGVALHKGQVALGNPLRALLCVGIAYFLIGVLVPIAALLQQGQPIVETMQGDKGMGAWVATAAGALGAIGAVCIIYAFKAGGSPLYVMPLVFGGAPLVNVITSALLHPPKQGVNPLLYIGFLLASIGAGMVLYFRPQA